MSDPCPTCGGEGSIPDYRSHAETTWMFECHDCEGTGESPANPSNPIKEGGEG